ncbi:MAG: HAD hydrolase-like protein [Herbiconiux sp.]|nr:HAD hydrolase-like protein [Herbiconiux sp.]
MTARRSDDTALGGTMVVFDWNGAIVIDADRTRAALNRVLDGRGLPPLGETEFSLRFRLPLGELFGRLGVPVEEHAAAEQEFALASADARSRLREGAGETLTELARHGAWLGVVSAASVSAVRFDQRALAVPAVWNCVDTSVADKYELLVRHRPTRPTAYYVGDACDDLRSASAAGYTAVGVTDAPDRSAALRAAGAVHVISALGELLTVLGDGTEAAQTSSFSTVQV